MSLAQRLDAADGVIDGRYFGRPIVETGARTLGGYSSAYAPAYSGTAAYGGYRTSTAAALDAADGVIDGRYYGRPIVETSGLGYGGYRAGSITRAGYYGSGYGSYSRLGGAYGAGYAGGYRTSTAAALDAADGVIDGRYYGRPIVETAPTYSGYSAYPRRAASVTRVGGYYPGFAGGSVTRLGGYYGGGVRGASITRLGGYSSYAPTTTYGTAAYAPATAAYGGYRTSTAAALDAADGVIDGRYFGRPIVETTGATRYAGAGYGGYSSGYARPAGSLAERLDAADGVIDGRYFGRRIVQA